MLFTRNIIYYFILGFLVYFLSSCGISKSLKQQPQLSQYHYKIPKRIKVNDSLFIVGKNQLRKNKQALWELYIQGDPLERGLANGSLTRELLQKQESIFFSKVKELVPSRFKQNLLRKFLAWYNRKLYLYIIEEYKDLDFYPISIIKAQEEDFKIYGTSLATLIAPI